MKCDNCPLLIVENRGEASMFPDEYCAIDGLYENIEHADGSSGCRIPWNRAEKIARTGVIET